MLLLARDRTAGECPGDCKDQARFPKADGA